MIIGLEGLPRSGKSFAAVRDHIIPALRSGRRLLTNVDGLKLDKLAAYIGSTEERVRELVVVLDKEACKQVHKHVKPGDLVVIDECHMFWVKTRQPLPPESLEFFAMHGHDKLDIVLMTQGFEDVHRSVLLRLERKNVYIKMSVMGKDDHFHCTHYQRVPSERPKFVRVGESKGRYEPEIYECYHSFNGGNSEGYEAYKSGGMVFWTPKMKMIFAGAGVAIVGSALLFGSFFFNPPQQPEKKEPVATAPQGKAATHTTQHTGVPDIIPTAKPKYSDPFTAMAEAARPRLAGYIVSPGRDVVGRIEFRSGEETVYGHLDFSDLRRLGWDISVAGNVAIISRDDQRVYVTAWPLATKGGYLDSDPSTIFPAGAAPPTAPAVAAAVPVDG